MWKPLRLYIQNLGSHLETDYKFVSGKPTLIQGSNLDDPEQESNGSGKSVLIDACAYALTGNFLRKVRDEEMINDLSSSATVEMTLYNPRLKQELVIKRILSRKKTSELEVTINGIEQKDKFSSINDGNTFLLKLIGVGREDLLSFYLISKEKYISFYRSSDNDKKGVISRFSNANLIEGVDTIIQREVEEIDIRLRGIEQKIEHNKSQIEVYENLIQETLVNHQREVQISVDEIKEKIRILEEKNVDLLETINTYKADILTLQKGEGTFKKLLTQLQTNIDSFTSLQFEQQMNEIEELKKANLLEQEDIQKKQQALRDRKQGYLNEISELDKMGLSLNHKKQDLSNLLAGKITCPECTHEFLLGKDVDVKSVESQILELQDDLLSIKEGKGDIQTSINNLKGEFDQLETERKQSQADYQLLLEEKKSYDLKIEEHDKQLKGLRTSYQSTESDMFKIQRTIKQKENEIISFQSQIETNTTLIVTHSGSAESLSKVSVEQKTEPYKVKIEDLQKEFPEMEKERQDIDHERFVKSEWVMNFKRFRTHLANKAIKNIEGYVNLFLRKMGSNLQVEIEGYKALASGEVREKIAPTVLRNGKVFGNFYKCSGGERGRIELSTILTQQSLINLSSPSGGLDLLFIDEILDAVDGRGFQSMARSLTGLEKTVNLVSHVNIPSNEGYNLITVEKSKGSSKIKL